MTRKAPKPPVAVSAREQELLELLQGIRLANESITVVEFARRAGYTLTDKKSGRVRGNKSALQRFPTLREKLHEYIGRVGREHLQTPSAEGALRRELAARGDEAKALRARLADAEERAAAFDQEAQAAREARRTAEEERDQLRGMVSALVARMAQTSVVHAPVLESKLVEIARRLVPGLADPAAASAEAPDPEVIPLFPRTES